jgi:hypothetical protein
MRDEDTEGIIFPVTKKMSSSSSSSSEISEDPLTREMQKRNLGLDKIDGENRMVRRAELKAINEENIDFLESMRVALQAKMETFYQSQITTVDPLDPFVVNKIFHPNSSTGTIKQSDIIALYLSDLSKAVKTPRVQVLDASLVHPTLRLKDRIYLKIPSHYDDELTVEYAVGFYMVNELRAHIPNFMMTYGMFACGETDRESEGLCDPRAPVTEYLAVEKISNSIPASEFVKTASGESLASLYLQVYLALLVAKEQCSFAHYDLHSDNVLIQRLKEPRKQRYTIRDMHYDLVLNFVAIIIDFGFSIATKVIDGRKLTVSSSYNSGVTRTYPEPNVSADMYRFFMSTQMDYAYNERFQWMYNFFQESNVVYDLKKAIKDQSKSYYYYPRSMRNPENIIPALVDLCLSYNEQKIRVPVELGYIAPFISTLDFYERFNVLATQSVMLNRITSVANIALHEIKSLRTQIRNEKDNVYRYYLSRKYVTLARLYIFYYDNFRETLENEASYVNFYNALRALVERVDTEDKSDEMELRKKEVVKAKTKFLSTEDKRDLVAYEKAKSEFDRTSNIRID